VTCYENILCRLAKWPTTKETQHITEVVCYKKKLQYTTKGAIIGKSMQQNIKVIYYGKKMQQTTKVECLKNGHQKGLLENTLFCFHNQVELTPSLPL
jgi:hypothetical protein